MKETTVGGRSLGLAFSYQVFFGTQLAPGVNVLYETPDYGGVGSGPEDSGQFLLDTIRDRVSDALTEYLKANVQ